VRKGDDFTTFTMPKVEKIRSLNLPDPQGPVAGKFTFTLLYEDGLFGPKHVANKISHTHVTHSVFLSLHEHYHHDVTNQIKILYKTFRYCAPYFASLSLSFASFSFRPIQEFLLVITCLPNGLCSYVSTERFSLHSHLLHVGYKHH
jgi:hypothetical protein